LPQSGLAESIKRLKVLAPEIPGAAEPNLEGLKNEPGVKTALIERCQHKFNIPTFETRLGCARDFGSEYFQPL
jgi:hypothetical protein